MSKRLIPAEFLVVSSLLLAPSLALTGYGQNSPQSSPPASPPTAAPAGRVDRSSDRIDYSSGRIDYSARPSGCIDTARPAD